MNMKLLKLMQERASGEESYFRAALLKEDIVRLEKLRTLARSSQTVEQLMQDGLYVGWTQGDLRTGELKEPLAPLMASVFAYEHGDTSEAMDAKILDNWAVFNKQRMKILVHCL
jgi:hypothetical protein